MAYDGDGPDPDILSGRHRAEPRSIPHLLSDLASETVLLLRQEIALFKAELHEKFGRIGQGATALGAGVAVALSGWFVLLACAVLALATVMPAWLAALIVGLVVVGIGVGLLLLGKNRLDADSLVPKRSLRSLREDEAWIKERLK